MLKFLILLLQQTLLLLLLLILQPSLSITPNDINILFNNANTLYSQGLLDQALYQYQEILKYNNNNADVNCNIGSIYYDINDIKNAEIYYRRALYINNNHQSALFNLASLIQDSNNNIKEALELYNRLLIIEPNSIDALSNIGAIYHRNGDYISAVSSYKKAIDIILNDSNNIDSNNNNEILSSLYEHYGRAIIRIADNKKLSNNTIDINAADSLLLEAQKLLNSSLHYNSNNSIAKHMLMSILADNCTNDTNNDYQASDDYITKLFDDFSSSFETSLEKLEYHAPSLLTKAVLNMNIDRYSLLIDLGCGTGLFGAMLSNDAKINIDYSVGVDLSKKMLKLASEKSVHDTDIKVYSSLYAGPMTQFISSLAKYRYNDNSKIDDYNSDIIDVEDIVNNGFDNKFMNGNKKLLDQYPILVVAADVFVYVGDLDPVFDSFLELKKNNDIFAFTTEALPEEDNNNKGFKLQANGRYAHKKSYIDKLLREKSFSIVTYESVILRKELGQNVYGHLYVFS